MALSIHPADSAHPGFFGEVEGIDLREPANAETVAAIEAGMDRFAVLVFHDQGIDDTRQLAFTRNFGPFDLADGEVRTQSERRLPMEVTDISNLGRDNEVLARDDRRRLFGLGNMLWHSDSSFKPIRSNTRYCTRGSFRHRAARPSSPICARPMTHPTAT
jgi:alpha-ketoglutarate-dependent 2,4-dichlorophenoxyacetate dioxygenase